MSEGLSWCFASMLQYVHHSNPMHVMRKLLFVIFVYWLGSKNRFVDV